MGNIFANHQSVHTYEREHPGTDFPNLVERYLGICTAEYCSKEDIVPYLRSSISRRRGHLARQ